MEELRSKLMEIWSRGTAASGSSKGGAEGFVDAIITRINR